MDWDSHLERIDRLEVVDVEKDLDVRQHFLGLGLDRVRLILPRRPAVREEQVVAVARIQGEHWLLPRRAQPHVRSGPSLLFNPSLAERHDDEPDHQEERKEAGG